MRHSIWVVLALLITGRGESSELKYKQRLTADLVKQIPGILKLFDPKSGHFGSGLWVCGDQERMYPLAVAYCTPAPSNRYFKNPELLSVILQAGDALISDADSKGRWMFRKKDGSTWGMIWMPWTYSRWIRTHFTYPDGSNVETIDQRNPYRGAIATGNVGFTFSSVGREYLCRQWAHGIGLDADLMASLILYGEEGAMPPPTARGETVFLLNEHGADRAATVRHGPWFLCASAYTAPVANSRWYQDRQNLVSIYHDKTGLILGGGNTKLQPAWSNFTVGNIALLAHKPGDENPDFLPRGPLYHVPSSAELVQKPELGLNLTYGPQRCCIRILPKDDRTLQYRLRSTGESGLPVAAHLTLMPHFGRPLETAAGQKFVLGDAPIELKPDKIGGWVSHAGCRLQVPATASLHWPRLPHNPYAKDGHSNSQDGRIEIAIPLDRGHPECEITLQILP